MTTFQKLSKLLKNSYSPYSKFKVSAIVLSNLGEFGGVNVENASYGATICAERVAITNAITNGATKISKLYILSSSFTIIPCGMCLQFLSEFETKETEIIVFNKNKSFKKYYLNDLLPIKFSSKGLKNGKQ